ncbi:hypothetical protein AOC36_04405 [Erysipelothrix larvae]|uniref:CAAX prenyl protease 2/Lysostaphin resistance protein A-like domain-containing protein n=1 Tax=Erysipelothrix larvae TaxID=1514105 RepID=A0A0X8GZR9_9FIRM|nr:type II CAAX endopeptidase family protein [Erysipelothrix larvae]AMC93239.1 hypothetical protein AOC36_04405 [Erysipelothrix larvae]
MKLKLREERNFTIRHTLWYSVIYFGVVQAIIPIILGVVAGIFGDYEMTASGVLVLPIYYDFIVYLVGLVLFYLVSIGVVRTQWELFKHNFLENIKTILILFVMMQVLVIASNIIIGYLMGTDTSSNQSNIMEIARYAPTFVIFVTLIFAPICEELLFRGGFYFGFVRSGMSETKATLISSFGFGLLHVAPSLFVNGSLVLSEVLYIIPYAFMGFFFTTAARKTNNIWGSITLHFLNNLLSVLILFLFSLY